MNKPFYKSRKVWSAVIAAIVTIATYYKGPELAAMIAAIGATLIAGFAAEDHGKAAAAIQVNGAGTKEELEEEEEETGDAEVPEEPEQEEKE